MRIGPHRFRNELVRLSRYKTESSKFTVTGLWFDYAFLLNGRLEFLFVRNSWNSFVIKSIHYS